MLKKLQLLLCNLCKLVAVKNDVVLKFAIGGYCVRSEPGICQFERHDPCGVMWCGVER